MGWIHSSYDWDWAAADASILRALELEPGSAEVLRHAGIQAYTLGRWNEAIDLANKAIERDPLRPNSYSNLGDVFLAVERDTEAEAAFRKALELDPDGAFRHYALGRSSPPAGQGRRRPAGDGAGNGRDLSALWIAARISRARPARRVRRGAGGTQGASTRGKWPTRSPKCMPSEARRILPSSGSNAPMPSATAALHCIKGDRLMRGLVGDPRYKAFLRKLKLPE